MSNPALSLQKTLTSFRTCVEKLQVIAVWERKATEEIGERKEASSEIEF